jgi:hypothetical protein
MDRLGRLHPSAVRHRPDAYVLLSRLTLGVWQVSQADRHITAVATFIATKRVLLGLMRAGFVPVDARQTHTRNTSTMDARHEPLT